MKIFGDSLSGNCYKIQLLLGILGKHIEWQEVDILKGDTRTDRFLQLNPNGKIPLLVLSDERCISESNAILHFLAANTPLVPTATFDHAKMLQWQFFEQYSHEPYIAVARFINLYLGLPEHKIAEYEQKQEGGYKALEVMEEQLHRTPYLVGDFLTLADISLYAYTHVAHQGGFSLDNFPAIKRWLTLIESHKGYVPMAQGT
jgi:glutathione S-transferase